MSLKKLNIEELYLFSFGIFYSIWVRFVTWTLPVKYWLSLLGNNSSHTELEKIDLFIRKSVYATILRLNKYAFWTNNCLVKSIVIRKLFLKYNVHTSVKLGTILDQNKRLKAHAWVFVNNTNFAVYNKE